MAKIAKCHGDLNKLGFAYQLICIKLSNTLLQQHPFQVIDDIVSYACAQLDLDYQILDGYGDNRKKVRAHQQEIIAYLGLQEFNSTMQPLLEQFVYQQALQLDSEAVLQVRARQFLKEQHYLCPSDSTFNRIVLSQRKQAQQMTYDAIHKSLSSEVKEAINSQLIGYFNTSPLEQFKQPPARPSPDSVFTLTARLKQIQAMGVLSIDLSEVHQNYQRILAKDVKRSSITRLRNLAPSHRYAALVCFLQHCYYDTLDFLADTTFKLLTWVQTRSTHQADKEILARSQSLEKSLQNYELLKKLIVDITIPDVQLRQAIYNQLGKDFLSNACPSPVFQQGKGVYVFDLFTKKYNYFRQFMPTVLQYLTFCQEVKGKSDLIEAIAVLKKVNQTHQRKLPKKLHKKIIDGKITDRHGWECALYLTLKDEVKNGNFVVQGSKRFAKIDDFFMPKEQWELHRTAFFARAHLPADPKNVAPYLKDRIECAYQYYFAHEAENAYARVENDRWVISVDPSETTNEPDKEKVKAFRLWLQSHLRTIKLPDLLAEVNNDIHFSEAFVLASQSQNQERWVETICNLMVTIMAHGCNIGIYTMSQITEVTYEVMRRITDWQLTDEALKMVLAWVVNALSKLTITTWWGEGKTSSSDAHLKTFHQKVLEQNYHPPFGDFALEFYTFVADNYAPFYGKPIECTDGEAPHVLDGHLYNESDLLLEEHFTDTRGSSKILFTAFSFLGKAFNPRIRGVQHHHIYRIDKNLDYGSLTTLLKHRNNLIHTQIIEDNWEGMAWFYASMEFGYATASQAMKRLLSCNEKNAFYQANFLYGQILKTEHILRHMTDPQMRQRKRKGLLKGEQMHQLAREVHYAYAGKVKGRDLRTQRLTCNCLTFIMACIVYWQAKEMMRVIESNPNLPEGLSVDLLQYVSPLGWANVVLYGYYLINRGLIKP